ncbi:MAG TPA: hypothetical protein DEP53_06105 [Bacteroidetes bacterium]|nr:hypothetical protein [Bacteroidota bacterium]
MLNRIFHRLLFFVVLPCLAFAQGVDLRGVVSDSTTGEKIPFANVTILGLNRGASTNLQGFYLIPNLSPGRYTIVASSVGYAVRTAVAQVRGTEPVVVNLRLPSKPVEMSEVTVTSAAKRELTEIHTSVHILEQRDIHAVPVAAQEDIFRSIGILPGVVSTSDVSSQFYVRGGAGDQNLILLDGMRIYNPYHAFGIFSVFDPDIVKATEVYTGAYPADYGGRLSSVVSLTTRDGGANAISTRANINFLSTKLQLDGPLPVGENVTFLVSGRKSLFSQTFTKFLSKDLPLSFYDGFAKVTIQNSESQAKYGLQTFLSGDDLKSANPNEPDYSWRTSATGFSGSGLIGDRLYITAVWYESRVTAERDAKQSKSIDAAFTSVLETGMRANAMVYLDSGELFSFGFDFSFPTLEFITTNSFGARSELTSGIADASASVRYQTAPARLRADLGLFLDVGSLMLRSGGIEALQPRINLSYDLWDTWKAKLALGRFTQNIITVNNEDDVISVFDAWIRVPEELKTEQADHVVLGLGGNVAPSLSTNVEAYFKNYGSLVLYNRDKVGPLDPDYIAGTGQAYGVETMVRFGSNLIDIYAAYTFSTTKVTSNGFTYFPRYDRRHNLNLLSVLHVAPGFDVTLRWALGSGFPFSESVGFFDRLNMLNLFRGSYLGETGDPYIILGNKNSARLPVYHRLDASAAYRFTIHPITGNVGVHIVNVYDRKNLFYFDRKTGQRTNMLPFFPTASLTLEY